MTNTLQSCKATREIASETLAVVLKNALSNPNEISEQTLRDNWLEKLRRNKNIFLDGWYMPPPHGIGVLFGSTKRNSRHNYKTLRSEKMWPKSNVFLDKKNGVAYLFASPVDKKTGIIGDFGLTIYLGDDSRIINHVKKCLHITKEIYSYIEVGMAFKDVYEFAEKIIRESGLTNNVTSSTDPTGKDYGHTIPASYFDWNIHEIAALRNGTNSWKEITEMISKKRVFVNRIEETRYQPGMAITLEPRLTSLDNVSIPMASFHTIVVINKDGSKELLTNFDRLFKITRMNYMF